MAEDKEVDYEEFLKISENLHRKGSGFNVSKIPNIAADVYATSHFDGYTDMSDEERQAVCDKIVAGLDEYKKQKAREDEEARNKPFKDVYDNINKKMEEDGMTLEEAKEAAKSDYYADNHIIDDKKQKEWEKNFEAYYKEQEVLEAREARENLIKNTDYKKVLEEIEKVRKDGKTWRWQVMDTAVGNYASSNVAGYESMSKEEQKNVRDAIISYGIPRYRGQKGKEEADRIAKEAFEAKEKHDNLLLQMQRNLGAKMATGMSYDNASAKALEELFEKEKITDPREQAAWKKELDDFNNPTLLARTKQRLGNAADRVNAAAGNFMETLRNIGAKKEEPAAQEAPKGVDVVNPVAANPEKVEEDANQKVRDRQARRIWYAACAMIGKGVESGKAMLEALADFLKKEKITDPKEQETLKQAVETYPKRVVEKENAAEEANKKSGRKVLQNGVVSKWLSRNKDKLIGGTAALLGTAWGVSALSSSAGFSGLGLLPTITALGVSSTVLPVALTIGTAVVATWYLGKNKMRKAVEAEMAKEKGETKRGPMPGPRGKDGGR